MERLKGWRASWTLGQRGRGAPNTPDSQVYTMGLVWAGPARGPAKSARRGSLAGTSPFLRKLSPPPSSPSPPAQRSRGSTASTAGLLTRRFWGWKSRFLSEGCPGARAEEGVARGTEPGSSKGSGPQRQRRTQRKAPPHFITPQSSSWDSPGPRPRPQGGAAGRGSAYTRGCWGPPNGLAWQGQGKQGPRVTVPECARVVPSCKPLPRAGAERPLASCKKFVEAAGSESGARCLSSLHLSHQEIHSPGATEDPVAGSISPGTGQPAQWLRLRTKHKSSGPHLSTRYTK